MLAAGDVATAAAWNVVVGDIVDHEIYVAGIRTNFAGYTTYTPTFTQLGAVPKTTLAYYLQIGKFVHGYFQLTVTGAGGTAGNAIIIGLPVAIRSGFNAFTPIGSSTVYDASSGVVYPGLFNMSGYLPVTQTANTNGTQYLGINNFGAALATGDIVGASFTYEAA
jgi:hypothetical protein